MYPPETLNGEQFPHLVIVVHLIAVLSNVGPKDSWFTVIVICLAPVYLDSL